MWSLQEAFENYSLAGDSVADCVRDRYVALAARTSPFSKAEKAVKGLELRRAEPVKPDPKKETGISEGLVLEIVRYK
ncbi:MAG TPA: hypothetical protein VF172_09125 [Nitrososphaera sp.]